MSLSNQAQSRYRRQMILPGIGQAGQETLQQSSVLCVGLGGLGSALTLYLVAAGVGRVGIIDGDDIALDNLHRQTLYQTAECGEKKVAIAEKRLLAINPECKIEAYDCFLTEENAATIIPQYDIIADGSDNFKTRYLLNDTCCAYDKPNVFAALRHFQGYMTVFPGKGGPCYRCWFERPPSMPVLNCAEAGVLGTLPGLLGIWQANEVIKYILNIGTLCMGRVMMIDVLHGTTRFFELPVDIHCRTCAAAIKT